MEIDETRILSLRETADKLGLHNEQVRRIEERALKKLKAYFDSKGITFNEANFREW